MTNTISLCVVSLLAFAVSACSAEVPTGAKTSQQKTPMTTRQHNYNPLTAEEKSILVNQDTERAGTGMLLANKSSGTYTCKQCDAPLYDSTSKFESHCGWPSFDDEIAGVVTRRLDHDGLRTEIICAACGGHLGHVFLNEHYTARETRHCVNSLSMNFVPEVKLRAAYFAAGCFWGPEYFFNRAKGVEQTPPKDSQTPNAKPLYAATTVGYMGGIIPAPTYKDVCTGNTGHAETLRVIYDENKTTYEDLVKLFFETHDSTQVNRQGPDIGTQYRSAIFYVNDEQRQVAEKIIAQLKKRGIAVATKLEKSSTFWFAEDYHQDYYDTKKTEPTCHVYRPIFGENK